MFWIGNDLEEWPSLAYGGGLENRWVSQPRGFESYFLRIFSLKGEKMAYVKLVNDVKEINIKLFDLVSNRSKAEDIGYLLKSINKQKRL